MDIEARLADIHKRITVASQEEARNDILRERSLKEKNDALKALKEEFGVKSIEEAEKLLTGLESQRDSLIDDLSTQLDDLGA